MITPSTAYMRPVLTTDAVTTAPNGTLRLRRRCALRAKPLTPMDETK